VLLFQHCLDSFTCRVEGTSRSDSALGQERACCGTEQSPGSFIIQ